MSICIQKYNQNQLKQLLQNTEVPLWLGPEALNCYQNKIILVAWRGKRLAGLWLAPLIKQNGEIIAKREYRFLPYASPILFESDNLKRREVIYELFEYLIAESKMISLPFDPSFKDFATIQGLGAFVEWRHTHVLAQPINLADVSSRLRNHIRKAQAIITVKSGQRSNFNFEQAIKGLPDEIVKRKKFATELMRNGNGRVIAAYIDEKVCAEILIATDSHSAYMIHSWQDKDAPRGTVSALIIEGVKWAFEERGLKQYDFEGSVLQGVDYYYSGFNCEITPYGYVYWSRRRDDIYKMIDKSIDIPGRKIASRI